MKRAISYALMLAVMIAACVPTASAVGTSALSAILMDADSGRVLYEQNADSERPIASITKLMTALVALEQDDNLDRVVEIKPEYTGAEGSSMYLVAGEKLTMRELFYGLLLNSGNDAAVAIAYITAGGVEAFAEQMNKKAEELGMTHSHFVNPNGLSEDGHYSTARDMAILASACLKNEQLVAITSTKTVTIGNRTMTNHNKLLWQYEGCIGMKTGYTILAGRTLISCAERNGQRLVAVTLCDSNDWEDHKNLLDYGFSAYPRTVLQKAGKEVITIPVTASLTRFVSLIASETVAYPLQEEEQVSVKYDIPESVEAPLSQGQVVGSMIYSLHGAEIARVDLICGKSVSRELAKQVTAKSFFEKLLGREASSDFIYQLPASG